MLQWCPNILISSDAGLKPKVLFYKSDKSVGVLYPYAWVHISWDSHRCFNLWEGNTEELK